MLTLVFIVNLSFFFFLTIYKPYYLSNFFRFSFINPITLNFIVSLPITLFSILLGPALLLNDSLLNKYYQSVVFISNVSLTFDLLVMIWVLQYLNKRIRYDYDIQKAQHFRLTARRLALMGIIFFILFLCSFYMLASHSFGLSNWISNPREGYQYHRSGAGQYYALCITFLSVSFVTLSLSLKNNSTVILGAIIYISVSFFMGSKGLVLSFFIYLLIFLSIRRYRYLSTLLGFLTPIVFLLMILNFGNVEFQSIVEYFDSYVNSASYFEAYFNNEIDLFSGKIFITSFWELVPRALYPEKPYVYGLLYLNEHFYPGAAELGHTPAFGGPLKEFADFGIAGVILFSTFNIMNFVGTFLYYILYKNLDMYTIRSNSKYFYLYLWLLAPSFLMFFAFPLNLILFGSIVFIISVLGRITIMRKHSMVYAPLDRHVA